jgi:hypothetical protein
MQFNYEQPLGAGYKGSTSITTSETEIFKTVNADWLRQSQLTFYYNIALGSATSVKIRYYYTPDNGTTWFQVPTKNDATGVLSDIPSVIDATSPAQSANSILVEDIPFSGSSGIRITGTAVGAAATLNTFNMYVRDN